MSPLLQNVLIVCLILGFALKESAKLVQMSQSGGRRRNLFSERSSAFVRLTDLISVCSSS